MNAANRSEAFCTLEGLPSDLLVRGDVNQARAVEGDEVAVLPFKLQDWFKVYREQEKVGAAAQHHGPCIGSIVSRCRQLAWCRSVLAWRFSNTCAHRQQVQSRQVFCFVWWLAPPQEGQASNYMCVLHVCSLRCSLLSWACFLRAMPTL